MGPLKVVNKMPTKSIKPCSHYMHGVAHFFSPFWDANLGFTAQKSAGILHSEAHWQSQEIKKKIFAFSAAVTYKLFSHAQFCFALSGVAGERDHTTTELFHNHIHMMVMKVMSMKMMYKPNSRRSMTVPIICQSCDFLPVWRWLSIWWRMALRSLLRFLSSSRTDSWDVFSDALSLEMPWRALAEMMLEAMDGPVVKSERKPMADIRLNTMGEELVCQACRSFCSLVSPQRTVCCTCTNVHYSTGTPNTIF